MDIQDKLIFTGFLGKEHFLEIDLNNLPINNILVSFNENSDVYVEVDSTRYSVTVECLEEASNCDLKFMHQLVNKKQFLLNSIKESLYPSFGLIVIKDSLTNLIIYKNYKVIPLAAVDENMFSVLKKVISQK